MNLLAFYQAVLPEQGWYCLFHRESRRHVWVNLLTKLAQATEAVADTPDWYFGTAAHGAKGGDYSGRKQSTVLMRRAFHLDIDCGEVKFAAHPDAAYPSQREGLMALGEFSRRVGLKPSLVMLSGAGIHAYWCLSEDVPPEHWSVAAKALKSVCQTLDFRADPACTTDSARVLRPPGTLHHNGQRVTGKDTGARYTFKEVLRALRGQLAASASTLRAPSGGEPVSVIQRESRNGISQDVLPASDGGAIIAGSRNETLFRLAAKYRGQGYDDASVLTLLRQDNQRCEPPLDEDELLLIARSVNRYTPNPLASPVTPAPQLNNADEDEDEPKEEALPEALTALRKTSGGKFRMAYTAAGEPVLMVCLKEKITNSAGEETWVTQEKPLLLPGRVFYATDRFEPEDELHESGGGVVIRYRIRPNTWQQDVIPSEYLADAGRLKGFLGQKNMFLNDALGPRAAQLLKDYAIMQFSLAREVPFARSCYGFQHLPGRELAWIAGSYAVHSDGKITRAVSGKAIQDFREQFDPPGLPPGGDGENTEAIARELVSRGKGFMDGFHKIFPEGVADKHRLAFLAALSSPLLQYAETDPTRVVTLSANGVTLSLYSSESGKGKTQLARAVSLAMSAGEPLMVKGTIGSAGGTSLSTVIRARAMFRNFPQVLDEITNTEPSLLSNYVYQIGNGSEKLRGLASGELSGVRGTWAGVSILTTNKSARDLLAVYTKDSPAEQKRLLELDVGDLNMEGLYDPLALSNTLTDEMEPNAGALGMAIARWALLYPGLHKLMVTTEARAYELFPQLSKADRFYTRLYAAMAITNAALKQMGIAGFDMKRINRVFTDCTTEAQEFEQANIVTLEDALLAGINALRDGFVNVRTDSAKAGESVGVGLLPKGEVTGRFVMDTNTLYLDASALYEWLKEQRMNPRKVSAYARANGIFVGGNKDGRVRKRMMTGIPEAANVRAHCYCVDMGRLMQTNEEPHPEPRADNVLPMVRKPSPAPSQAAAPQETIENRGA